MSKKLTTTILTASLALNACAPKVPSISSCQGEEVIKNISRYYPGFSDNKFLVISDSPAIVFQKEVDIPGLYFTIGYVQLPSYAELDFPNNSIVIGNSYLGEYSFHQGFFAFKLRTNYFSRDSEQSDPFFSHTPALICFDDPSGRYKAGDILSIEDAMKYGIELDAYIQPQD